MEKERMSQHSIRKEYLRGSPKTGPVSWKRGYDASSRAKEMYFQVSLPEYDNLLR